MEEFIQLVEGVTSVEVGADDDGFKLYIERSDGDGVAIELTSDEYDSLEKTFMLMDPETGGITYEEVL